MGPYGPPWGLMGSHGAPWAPFALGLPWPQGAPWGSLALTCPLETPNPGPQGALGKPVPELEFRFLAGQGQ